MNMSIVFILVGLIDTVYSSWRLIYLYLYNDEKFTYYNGPTAEQYSGNFLLPSTQTTANFITCATPPTSYITLSSASPSAQNKDNRLLSKYCYLTVDLYFQGTWTSETVTIQFSSFSYTYNYIPPPNYQVSNGFCDNIPYDIRTLNFAFQLPSPVYGNLQFTSSNTNDGQVSIRNIHITDPNLCYYICETCTADNYKCVSCYYGSPTNSVCPPCPSNQYFEKKYGCRNTCDIYQQLYSNGFCNNYPVQTYSNVLISTIKNEWSIIYDPQHLDTSPTILGSGIYGIFKFNSGIYKFYYSNLAVPYQIGLKISVVTYNDIPINCGISFMINNNVIGIIYRNESGYQTHNFIIYETNSLPLSLGYTSIQKFHLIVYAGISSFPILFSARGNYNDETAGWGLEYVYIVEALCPQYCQLCEVSFKCKICKSGYFQYKNNTCIANCDQPYQKLDGSYCYDFDDETPYSQYQTYDFVNNTFDPDYKTGYTLISQTGTNFMKGSDIYYSYFNTLRIFGGPFTWAQAKFQRIHNIVEPHYSITIAFYILYGPAFPSDGQFIYTIENKPPIYKSANSFQGLNNYGGKFDKVYERIDHYANTLTISWECFGPNNEPVNAYCGFYYYYVTIHKCQPYCSSCQDLNTCIQWSLNYDPNVVKFSQAECLSNEYYDKYTVGCLVCPASCLTCTSKIDCQTCQPTYIQSKLGCICKLNQWEDQNQCVDCPIECNQCISPTQCINCLVSNNRQLKNQQCICIDGYYPISGNPKCKRCHQFCDTCSGPTSNDCLTCNNNIANIETVGQTCQCPTGYFYKEVSKTCSQCNFTCQTCFNGTIDGCLSCDSNLNRILIGLNCRCLPGYYYLNEVCTDCPIQEVPNFWACFKFCPGTQQVWHTNTCNSCDSGFELVSGQCLPICGDQQIIGIEQCEDNNTTMDDLCYNCQFQCPVHCLTCNASTTLPCPDICGDKMVTGIEECEDGNNIQYDGCFNCMYSCQPQCTKCIKGECFECLTSGWQIDPTVQPWQCKEICGDLKIVGQEQCEDGNQDDKDGCYNCRYFCRYGCSSCNYTNKTCLKCELPGFIPENYYCKNICGDMLVVTDPNGFYLEECDDGNTINYDGCSDVCKFQCQIPSICITCVNNRCELCANGYQLSNQKICLPICGDQVIVVGESCENSFILPYKGCQNCQAKCQATCLTCDNFGLGCQICKEGYYVIDNLCYSICGDKIITEDEECDDGNLVFGDGCHQCSYSCPQSCSICHKGVCLECYEDYYYSRDTCIQIKNEHQDARCDSNCLSCSIEGYGCLMCKSGFQNIDNKCWPVCGDGLVLAEEDCDDGNSIFGDGCHQCSYSCPLPCSLCSKGVCYDCYEGYQYIKNSCVKLKNEIQDARCDSNCSSCSIEGLGCLVCKSGFQNVSNKCQPICGDKLVTAHEDCDDGNLTFDDGCHQCSFSCPISCIDCHQGVCLNCGQENFYYEHQCFELLENVYLKEDTNFEFVELVISQAFIANPSLTSRIQMKIFDFYYQDYSQIGQYIEIMDSSFPYIDIEIYIKCQENKKLESQFYQQNYQNGFEDSQIIFSQSCHNTFNHIIKFSFRLQKIIMKNQLLIIKISEDQFKLSTLFTTFRQKLLEISFIDA
ncbi:unnamed protein product (macronuclear) [Paramecium tetraurelia]|uniref:EGF-like domain-containing protein n=1 Tax=Paramecium tetraurelia TaxID=5888 RepID=A0E7C5_PARTE|nr:uncharacterized protein GSPATT00023920001 [Paramecium tetraurelia]CAK91192.1 unnamed protein product [Paramecium tetraurelia]|eukprot:XP_001458589.1 hypothetical protein (macronuclear) [Paramecium tetraurelia strain d4-2]